VPSCPPPPGSSVTTQRRRRSQAGPLDSWGQGRLHEHQPKLKCLFLLPCWLCSCPCARRPPAHLGSALCTPEDQRCQEAVRESRGAAGVQSVSRPADPTSTLRPRVERPPGWGHAECRRVDAFLRRTGSRFRAAAPVNFSVRVSPDLSALPCLPLGYKWVASGRGGTRLSEGFALGWEYLTHARFQKGLELSRQAPILPEWPLLPAKEHHQHTHTSTLEIPRSAPRLA